MNKTLCFTRNIKYTNFIFDNNLSLLKIRLCFLHIIKYTYLILDINFLLKIRYFLCNIGYILFIFNKYSNKKLLIFLTKVNLDLFKKENLFLNIYDNIRLFFKFSDTFLNINIEIIEINNFKDFKYVYISNRKYTIRSKSMEIFK